MFLFGHNLINNTYNPVTDHSFYFLRIIKHRLNKNGTRTVYVWLLTMTIQVPVFILTILSQQMWLHYLSDKLISEVKYKNKKSKIHTSSLASLKHLKNSILNFSSAKHFVTHHLQS